MSDPLEEIRRIKQRNAQRRKAQKRRKRIVLAAVAVFVLLVIIGSVRGAHKKAADDETLEPETIELSEKDTFEENVLGEAALGEAALGEAALDEAAAGENDYSETEAIQSEEPVWRDYTVHNIENAAYMGSEELHSDYGILINADTMEAVGVKNAADRIVPASMTKILTVLVACEKEPDIEAMVPVTIEATDYAYSHGLAAAGFAENETVKVKDLLYGTILPSGADAAYALACHTAGSYEAFIDMMNEKLAELGLAGSAHFTNAVGLYDENHYCTVRDMAVILAAAMDNPAAREVLSAHRYTTTATAEHPEGISLSNLFLRRIEDKDTKGEVIGAKTGYVSQSGNCAASYYTGNDGRNFICVTVKGHSSWRAIYDHVAVYNIYAAGNTAYHKD